MLKLQNADKRKSERSKQMDKHIVFVEWKIQQRKDDSVPPN